MSDFKCQCHTDETYTIRANCTKPEHQGKDVLVCKKCKKGVKSGEITGCVIAGCSNEGQEKKQ